jgi:long-chain acyl-CoA synthetase
MSGAAEDIVLVAGDWRVTRAEYASRLARAITVLRGFGVEEGACIGVALRNCPQFFELFAAAGLMGAKSVPIAWRLKREEVSYLIADSGARAIFYDADSAAQMAGLPGAIPLEAYEARLAAAEPAAGIDGTPLKFNMELYSSGTTGRPKAIERGQPTPEQMERLTSGAFNLPKVMGVDGPGEVHMMTGPLYHSQPIGFSTQALAARQRVVMMSGGFDAEICLATIEREKVTWITTSCVSSPCQKMCGGSTICPRSRRCCIRPRPVRATSRRRSWTSCRRASSGKSTAARRVR